MSAIGEELLSNLAGGIATGAMGGPIGMAIGGLIGVAKSVAPEVNQWIGANDKTIAAATAAVSAITGSDDADAALATLSSDPAKTAALRVQLGDIAAQQQAEDNRAYEARQAAALADVADARKQTLALAQQGSPLAWSAAALSVIIIIGFFISFWTIASGHVPDDKGAQSILNIMVGTLVAGFTAVVGYWLGSSSGSRGKDGTIASLSTLHITNTKSSK